MKENFDLWPKVERRMVHYCPGCRATRTFIWVARQPTCAGDPATQQCGCGKVLQPYKIEDAPE